MATLERVLLESGSWVDYPFQILKWPRPERSGVIAILVAYVLLCVYSEAFIVHEYAENLSEISPRCLLFPFLPSCEKLPDLKVENIEKDYKLTRLYQIPGIRQKKHVCSCRLEIRSHWKGSTDYVRSSELEDELFTCDSFLPDVSENWETAVSTVLEDGSEIDVENRWHCE